jgi:diaminohydroxyphosphoribosylaminopyrimidine deaminase/5-amino-6-(5-phosphoribosylamino)uracil reductase
VTSGGGFFFFAVRLVPGTDPRPIVLDTHLRIPVTARVLQNRSDSNRPLIVCGPDAPANKEAELVRAGAEVARVQCADGMSLI